MAVLCSQCGEKQGFLDLFDCDPKTKLPLCPRCDGKRTAAAEEERKRRVEAQRKIAEAVILTTTHGLDGFRVKRYLGIDSVEIVIGTGIFSEITGDIADMFGARSTAFEKKLQAAKDYASSALKQRAAAKGANAVVGVDMDYTEFSGNRVALILNGTLVEVERIEG